MNWQEEINNWKKTVFDPNSSDVLLQLNNSQKVLEIDLEKFSASTTFQLPICATTKKILREAHKNIKHQGLNSLGLTHEKISFTHQEKEFHCPIFIKPIGQKQKITDDWVYFELLEGGYFNPFLVQLLQLNNHALSQIDRTAFQNMLFEKIPSAIISKRCYLSNFHPHRFILYQELEALEEKPQFHAQLSKIFQPETQEPLLMHEGDLFPIDPSQSESIITLRDTNIILQGPPGTGKSQVIANVTGKCIASGYTVLIASEKMVALQVVKKMFQQSNLEHLCLLAHQQTTSSEFVASLLEGWKKMEVALKPVYYNKISALKEQQLQLLLDKIRQPDLIAGLSFLTFKEKYALEESVVSNWRDSLPSHEEWQNALKEYQNIPHKDWQKLSEVLLYFQLPDKFEKRSVFKKDLADIILICNKLGFSKNAEIKDFEQFEKLVRTTELYFYDGVPLTIALFETDSALQKTFYQLRNEFLEKVDLLQLLEDELKVWNEKPTLSSLLSYAETLSSTNKFNLKEKWKKKAILKHTNLDLAAAKNNIQCLIKHHRTKEEIINIQKSLREAGLSDDLTTLEQIHLLILKTRSADPSLHRKICLLSQEERIRIYQQRDDTSKVRSFLKNYTRQLSDIPLIVFLERLITNIDLIDLYFHSLQRITTSAIRLLVQSQNITEANNLFASMHWQRVIDRFPQLNKLSPKTFESIIEEIEYLQKTEQDTFAQYIHQQQQKIFAEYHRLLQTPAKRLTASEKQWKSELQKGKRILSKAFAKKRVFPSPYELFNSEAIHWIKILKPVLLFSPAAIATHLPLKHAGFDLIIMDEAGQIPFAHTLGALYRGKRYLIAGDEQQMSPQKNFRQGTTDLTDILSWMQYYWKNQTLTYHYRSEHSNLIQFSNRYFYNNELKVFPYAEKVDESAIEVITTNGKFLERQNTTEAKIAAELIENLVDQKCTDFGVITFSQAQLACISEHLSTKAKVWINEAHHQVLYDSLENVQGDQCSHLIVSMGYGYNEADKFAKRFGPINQLHGEKRLNVLMSRAQKKITFIRSVRAEDFVISDNIGVDMLRLLMRYLDELENSKTEEKYNLKPQKELRIRNYSSALDLSTDYQLYTSRGYETAIVF
ncbi:MAG: ATP-binding protein [Crocinitomicaceae bacterium]|nr:ATP-binding protein [Crocinitomicaceae bacterium]